MNDVSPTIAEPKPKAATAARPFQLRLWPAIVIVVILRALMDGPRLLEIDNMSVLIFSFMLGPLLGFVSIAVWWLFFSRVSWLEGFGMLGFGLLCGGILFVGMDRSMGMSVYSSALPMVITVGVAWLIVSMLLPWSVRRIGLMVTIVSTCFCYSLLRFDGVDGGFKAAHSFRWDKTAEQRYVESLAKAPDKKPAAKTPSEANSGETQPLIASEGDWVGFRGPNGDSVYTGEPISEDWTANPPPLKWKRPIGPGWSSVVVVGKYLFTQEQRDKLEVVTAHDIETGETKWEFSEEARFEESIAGPGPRATPLFHDGMIYVVGAKGSVNRLDALTGERKWHAEMVGKDVKTPEWGYSSSPVVVGNKIVTLPGKPDDHAVVAFDALTGKEAWALGKGEHSYTSAQLATICGVPQVLAFTSAGLIAIEPESGKILWQYDWDLKQVARCVQPYVDGDTVTISTFMGNDMRKLQIAKEGDKWNQEVLWHSTDLKPYFNDMVVQDGYAYGFDNKIFACIDLKDGKRKWKGGRYGNGQVLLLAQQKKLLVQAETGEVVLLEANPEKLKEVAKFKALDGKTWNHPVVAHGLLFVRNGEEMACFDVRTKKQAE
jgi:outer membrane protein assembly factor BamB